MPLFTRIRVNSCRPKLFYLQNSLLSVCKRFVNESYYDILKIPETCSSKDVREAFINLSKENHPDKHLNDPSMHERFIRINEAYSVLINPLSRRAYDINLYHKKKLGAPEERHYQHYTASNPTTSRTSTEPKSSSRSSAKTTYNTSSTSSSSSYSHGDPFTFHYQTSNKQHKTKEEAYYGIKGVKKISNKRIASIVVLTSLLAALIQYVSIRNRVIKAREEAIERTRKYALLNAMAREKAKLYGTDYQINLLKKSLKSSFDPDNDDPSKNGSDVSNNNITDDQSSGQTSKPPLIVAEPTTAKKCKKCNSKKCVN